MRSFKIWNPYQRRIILVIKSRKMRRHYWGGGEGGKKCIEEFDAENMEEAHSKDLDVDGMISIHNSNK
jgi:hypothetical protein